MRKPPNVTIEFLGKHKRCVLEIQSVSAPHRFVCPLQLFFFDQHSPGSPFLLPHGTRIINKMYDVVRAQYRKRGFQEVVTPNIYNSDLWKTSGHWVNYKVFDAVFALPFLAWNQKIALSMLTSWFAITELRMTCLRWNAITKILV